MLNDFKKAFTFYDDLGWLGASGKGLSKYESRKEELPHRMLSAPEELDVTGFFVVFIKLSAEYFTLRV